MRSRRVLFWIGLLILVLLIPAVLTYAYAASNAMPANVAAGEGSNTISGYTISNIHYQLDASDPTYLSDTNSVQFTINPGVSTGGTVKVQLTHNNLNAWYNCNLSGGVNASCNVPASTVTVQGISNIRIVAVQ